MKALRRLQSQGLRELHQANELEQPFPKVIQDKKGFMVGDTRFGRDVLAKEDVAHALGRIIGPGNRGDIDLIYAAYVNKCEYFVTNELRTSLGWAERGTSIPTRDKDPPDEGIH